MSFEDSQKLALLTILLGIALFVNAYITMAGFSLSLDRAVTCVPILVQLLIGAILMISALAMFIELPHVANGLIVLFAIGILVILALTGMGIFRLTLWFVAPWSPP